MSKIVITTDSGLDPINEDTMISGQITRDNIDNFRDVKEISNRRILEELKEHTFKTSSPIMGDYYDMFEKYLEDGNDIIHLCMSSGISEGSVNAPNMVANDLMDEYENKIYIVDTLNATTGGTLINEYAKELVEKGMSVEEIITELNRFKKYIQTSFYVPNPEGFIKSGRDKSSMCAKDKALLLGAKATKLAGIKFRVDFNDEGNLYTKNLMRVKTSLGMLKMVKEIVNETNIESYDPSYVVVGNVEEKDVSMDELTDYLNGLEYFNKVIRQDINGVVACYGSEDLCGISLIKKP